jgi:hypothetical protein
LTGCGKEEEEKKVGMRRGVIGRGKEECVNVTGELNRIWIWNLILTEMVVIENTGKEEKYSKLDEVDRELHTLGDHSENLSH